MFIMNLSINVLSEILSFLEFFEVARLAVVSKSLNKAGKMNHL